MNPEARRVVDAAPAPKREAVKVWWLPSYHNGQSQQVEVQGYARRNVVVHRPLREHGGAIGPVAYGWAISHLPSGVAIRAALAIRLEDALQAAAYLDLLTPAWPEVEVVEGRVEAGPSAAVIALWSSVTRALSEYGIDIQTSAYRDESRRLGRR